MLIFKIDIMEFPLDYFAIKLWLFCFYSLVVELANEIPSLKKQSDLKGKALGAGKRLANEGKC